MEKIPVHIIAQISNNNIIFIICANGKTSSLKILKGQACRFGGNPYGLFGEAVSKTLNVKWNDTSMTVSETISGDIKTFA